MRTRTRTKGKRNKRRSKILKRYKKQIGSRGVKTMSCKAMRKKLK